MKTAASPFRFAKVSSASSLSHLWATETGQTLGDAHCVPAGPAGQGGYLIQPVANHNWLLRLAARLRKSKLKNWRVRFFKSDLGEEKADRDERRAD
ncbi:MAG TPA: hypothetical protein VGM27_06060 [Acidobacteriaceae bacterium]|jgi:hypothetical protein